MVDQSTLDPKGQVPKAETAAANRKFIAAGFVAKLHLASTG